MSLLGNLDFHYQQSSPHVRKKLLGSIFTGKLVLENGNYRTTGLNEAVALIGLFQKDLQNKKAEHLAISDKTFGNVPMTGQLSNHFVEGMRKIYELEPFIKMESSLADERGKASKIYKRAV